MGGRRPLCKVEDESGNAGVWESWILFQASKQLVVFASRGSPVIMIPDEEETSHLCHVTFHSESWWLVNGNRVTPMNCLFVCLYRIVLIAHAPTSPVMTDETHEDDAAPYMYVPVQ